MTRRWVTIATIAGACGGGAPIANAPAPSNAPAPRDAGALAAIDCPGAAADARRRHADATVVEHSDALDTFDLDGDGLADAVYRASNDDFSGNSVFLVYRCTPGGATYLGELIGFGFGGPRCATPPVGGAPCRLTVRRRMLHDDYQDELYDLVDGRYAHTDDGAYTPGRRP